MIAARANLLCDLAATAPARTLLPEVLTSLAKDINSGATSLRAGVHMLRCMLVTPRAACPAPHPQGRGFRRACPERRSAWCRAPLGSHEVDHGSMSAARRPVERREGEPRVMRAPDDHRGASGARARWHAALVPRVQRDRRLYAGAARASRTGRTGRRVDASGTGGPHAGDADTYRAHLAL